MFLNLRRPSREQGFTLVELMVTIIIFGILTAVAVPIFVNQRNDQIRAQVRSDVHTAVQATKTALVANPNATTFQFYRSSNAPIVAAGTLEVRDTTQSGTVLNFTGPIPASQNPVGVTTSANATDGYSIVGHNDTLSSYYYFYNSVTGEYYDNTGAIDRSWDSK